MLGLALLSLVLARSLPRDQEAIGIRIATPRGISSFPMDPGVHRAEGPVGVSVLRIAPDLSVAFVESPCPNQVCIAQGPIRRAGEARACVPNQVLVEITGRPGSDPGLDGVTR